MRQRSPRELWGSIIVGKVRTYTDSSILCHDTDQRLSIREKRLFYSTVWRNQQQPLHFTYSKTSPHPIRRHSDK